MLELTLFFLFPAVVVFAGVIDLLTMKIPNEVSLLFLILFLIAAPISSLDAMFLVSHICAGSLMLAVGMGLFAVGWIGGGDAKLMACISLWFGFPNLLEFLFLTALSGVVIAAILLAFRRIRIRENKFVPAWLVQLHSSKGVPYGVALSSSTLVLYPYTAWFSIYGR